MALYFGILCSGNIWAGRIIDEKSEFGKFEIIEVEDGCKIVFHHNNGKTYELITHDFCGADEDSFIALKPVTEDGGWKFPIKTECSEEVHLFETPTNFRPSIETAHNTYFIDDIGKCNCDKLYDGDKVKIKLLIKTWDTGDEFICLSIVLIKRDE